MSNNYKIIAKEIFHYLLAKKALRLLTPQNSSLVNANGPVGTLADIATEQNLSYYFRKACLPQCYEKKLPTVRSVANTSPLRL